MRFALACLALCLSLPALAQDMTYQELEDLTRGRYATLTAHLPVADPAAPAPCDRTRPARPMPSCWGPRISGR